MIRNYPTIFLGYNVVCSVEIQPPFRRNMLRPYSELRINKARNLLKKATCSSEKSVDFHRTTLRYIPEARTLRNHRMKNPESHVSVDVY
jgi:hypothetical protein